MRSAADLHYIQHANLAQQDTLFVHGNLSSHVWWLPTLAPWQALGSQGSGSLVFADWRGCGNNPPWPSDRKVTLVELAEDLLELNRRLGLRETALVGHSLGGLIALQMMVLEPSKFSKALLLNPVGCKGVSFDPPAIAAFRRMATSREFTGLVILGTVHKADIVFQRPEPMAKAGKSAEDCNVDQGDTVSLRDQIIDHAFKAVRGVGASVLEIISSVNLESKICKLHVPTTVVHGVLDRIIPLSDSEHLVSVLPNGNLVKVADVGHCWNIEDPIAFTEFTRQWLRSRNVAAR